MSIWLRSLIIIIMYDIYDNLEHDFGRINKFNV